MKHSLVLIAVVSVIISSCSVSKTYFTTDVRNKIENAGVPLNKLQFYIDRDVELKREITQAETHLNNGEVKIENGKYVSVIHLKKNTPGVCSGIYPDKVLISFETGPDKFLTFGKTKFATAAEPYRILAFNWMKNNDGLIQYEGKSYHIIDGTEASVMIKSKFLRKADEVKHRNMEGVKIAAN